MDEGLINCWRRFIVRGSTKRQIKMAGLSCSGRILNFSGRLRLCFWGSRGCMTWRIVSSPARDFTDLAHV